MNTVTRTLVGLVIGVTVVAGTVMAATVTPPPATAESVIAQTPASANAVSMVPAERGMAAEVVVDAAAKEQSQRENAQQQAWSGNPGPPSEATQRQRIADGLAPTGWWLRAWVGGVQHVCEEPGRRGVRRVAPSRGLVSRSNPGVGHLRPSGTLDDHAARTPSSSAMDRHSMTRPDLTRPPSG